MRSLAVFVMIFKERKKGREVRSLTFWVMIFKERKKERKKERRKKNHDLRFAISKKKEKESRQVGQAG